MCNTPIYPAVYNDTYRGEYTLQAPAGEATWPWGCLLCQGSWLGSEYLLHRPPSPFIIPLGQHPPLPPWHDSLLGRKRDYHSRAGPSIRDVVPQGWWAIVSSACPRWWPLSCCCPPWQTQRMSSLGDWTRPSSHKRWRNSPPLLCNPILGGMT